EDVARLNAPLPVVEPQPAAAALDVDEHEEVVGVRVGPADAVVVLAHADDADRGHAGDAPVAVDRRAVPGARPENARRLSGYRRGTSLGSSSQRLQPGGRHRNIVAPFGGPRHGPPSTGARLPARDGQG